MCTEWDMLGQFYKLSERWVGPIITKILISTRWRLNTLIDVGQPKLVDVTYEQWNILVKWHSTEDSQILSKHIRSISQRKGSRIAQLKAIERDAIVKLVRIFHFFLVSKLKGSSIICSFLSYSSLSPIPVHFVDVLRYIIGRNKNRAIETQIVCRIVINNCQTFCCTHGCSVQHYDATSNRARAMSNKST